MGRPSSLSTASSIDEHKQLPSTVAARIEPITEVPEDADEAILLKLGYRQEFKRELYSASAYLVPAKYKAPVGWFVGWLNMLGQVSAIASVEFSLAGMIFSALEHAPLKSSTYIPRYIRMHLIGWSNNGLSFLLGVLSVSWTMTDSDCVLSHVEDDGTAHISEEIKRASIAAPAAIWIAVIGTGVCGWILNVVLILCSGPLDELPGTGGYAMATIIYRNVGKNGFLALWFFVCLCAFTVVATELQACSRTFFAFSRDHGLPDRGLFSKLSKSRVPVYAVLLVVFWAAVLIMLDFASIVAVDAVFALCAIALDSSYIIPIACRLIFANHPDVAFQPGPFALPPTISKIVSVAAIGWTCFVCVILALPTVIPVTATSMNYAAPITGLVLLVSGLWYVAYAHRFYKGPRNLVEDERLAAEANGAAEVAHGAGAKEQ
ncbi:amino acid permease [Pseudohyphozyma bogoriensis]|nr:amino acid permease [Pseudohyphozyma bogoriensis]